MENDRLKELKRNNNLQLAPETMRIRDAIIEKYFDTPLDKLSGKLQALITDETDTGTKLGIFSARVEILRMRFSEIAEKKYVKSDQMVSSQEIETDGVVSDESDNLKEGWMTLKILEASEVNGVRFPEGVKIDVHADDAKKLLESKKAELVSMKIEESTQDIIEDNLEIEADDKEKIKKKDEEFKNDQAIHEENKATSSEDQEPKTDEDTALNPEEMADLKK